MGNQKSLEDSPLITYKRPQDWEIVAQHEAYQLWQHKQSSKKFMAYQLDYAQIDNEQKIQLYHFRKLNSRHLVTIEAILSHEKPFLCTEPKNFYLLVEHIPCRLNSFTKRFDFREAVIILSAAFAAYKLLYHLFGPLYTSEQMIGFTENGQTKVWVNDNFSNNEPSKAALGLGNMVMGRYTEQNMQEKSELCVKRLFEIVQLSTKNGYPLKFKQEITQIKTFGQGEEFMGIVCMKMGLDATQLIPLQKRFQQPLNFLTQTRTISEKGSKNMTQPYTGRQNESILFKSNVQNTRSNHNISIEYNNPVQNNFKHNNIIQNKIPLQHQAVHFLKSNDQNIVKSTAMHHKSPTGSIILQPSSAYISPQMSKQVIITSNLISHERINSRLYEKQNHNPLKSQEHPIETRQTFQAESFKVIEPKSLKNDHKNLKDLQGIALKNEKVGMQKRASSQDHQYQLLVHQIASSQENDHIKQQEQQDRSKVVESKQSQKQKLKTQQFWSPSQPLDEIKRWQESLLRYSIKRDKQKDQDQNNKAQNHSQEQQYLSQQRDKVYFLEMNKQQPINQVTTEDLQKYIRNKYGLHLSQNKENHTQEEENDGTDHQNVQQLTINNHSLKFVQTYTQFYRPNMNSNQEIQYNSYDGSIHQINSQRNINQENQENNTQRQKYGLDHNKYTFGKIQLDPLKATRQYNRALTKQRTSKDMWRQQGKSQRFKEPNNKLADIQNKYERYVKNKSKYVPKLGLESKDISQIMRVNDSLRRQFVLHEFIQNNSNNRVSKVKTCEANENSSGQELIGKETMRKEEKQADVDASSGFNKTNSFLTYDRLRQLLWA